MDQKRFWSTGTSYGSWCWFWCLGSSLDPWRGGWASEIASIKCFNYVTSVLTGFDVCMQRPPTRLCFWKLDSMQDKLHTSEVYVAELLSARAIGRELVQRAHREIKEHLVVCPRHHEVIHDPIAGRVWHAHRGCSKLMSASRVESLPPCSYCADGELFNLPDSYGMTLVEACEDWLRLTDD